jgi:hypothetical protein
MPNSRTPRIIGRIVKLMASLLVFSVCGVLLWRIFSSGDPDSMNVLRVNEYTYEAYKEHGGALLMQYQYQTTITKGEKNAGYFSVTQYVFIPEANQVQLVFRYNNSTIKHLARDYELEAIPDKSEDLFDVTLVTTVDRTPDNREDNADTAQLTMERYYPTSFERTETSLYTYYRFVFDNVEITPDMLYVFADIYYLGDLDYEERPLGTLCLYDDESPWVDYKLSRTERKMLGGK